MSRRVSALMVAGALVSAAAGVPASFAASPARVTRPATSVAVFGDGSGLFRVATRLTAATAHQLASLNARDGSPEAAAINPVGGNDGLLCTGEDRIWPVHGLRRTPALQGGSSGYLSLTPYTQEGGSGFNFVSCQGVAMHGGFALATGDEQGVVQLTRTNGSWRIDRRVLFPGLNEGGHSHRRGWIRFDTSLVGSDNVYNAVAIAPEPQSDGKYLGVAVDRIDGALVVIDGVGTASPQPVGLLSSPSLVNNTEFEGDAAVAFLPGSANRAVISTGSGFAVLDLHKPAAPALRVATTVAGGSVEPAAITISSDGNHLAIAVGGRVYGYRNVLGAVRKGQRFVKQVSFRLGSESTELVDALGYTLQDRLAVLHGSSTSHTGWHLTIVSRVPGGHHTLGASFRTTAPLEAGTLSVWPSY